MSGPPSMMLSAVTPEVLIAYLASNHWRSLPSSKADMAHYVSGDSQTGYEVAVPLHSSWRDYTLRVGEALRTLEVATSLQWPVILRRLGVHWYDSNSVDLPSIAIGSVLQQLGRQRMRLPFDDNAIAATLWINDAKELCVQVQSRVRRPPQYGVVIERGGSEKRGVMLPLLTSPNEFRYPLRELITTLSGGWHLLLAKRPETSWN